MAFNWKSLLPVAGGIAGTIVAPGIGTSIGAGLGSAAANAIPDEGEGQLKGRDKKAYEQLRQQKMIDSIAKAGASGANWLYRNNQNTTGFGNQQLDRSTNAYGSANTNPSFNSSGSQEGYLSDLYKVNKGNQMFNLAKKGAKATTSGADLTGAHKEQKRYNKINNRKGMDQFGKTNNRPMTFLAEEGAETAYVPKHQKLTKPPMPTPSPKDTTIINIEKRELLVNPEGMPQKRFDAPPHPKKGTNPEGDREVPVGWFIIPNKDVNKYLKMWEKVEDGKEGAHEKVMEYLNNLPIGGELPKMKQGGMAGRKYGPQKADSGLRTGPTNYNRKDLGYRLGDANSGMGSSMGNIDPQSKRDEKFMVSRMNENMFKKGGYSMPAHMQFGDKQYSPETVENRRSYNSANVNRLAHEPKRSGGSVPGNKKPITKPTKKSR